MREADMYKAVKVFWGIFVSAAVLAGAAPFVWAGKDTVIPGIRLNGTGRRHGESPAGGVFSGKE